MKISKLKGYILSELLNLRIKPETLQLPITGKCNSRCVTCNIWKQQEKGDIDYIQLQNVFEDEYFDQIKNVGVNGGEPFLHRNIVSVIKAVMALPKLERIYLISNGLNTDKIIRELQEIHSITRKRNVKLFLTISLDGLDEIYSEIRGIPKGFERVKKTIDIIRNNMENYCESLTIGTTVSIGNVNYLKEIQAYAQKIGVPINFHIAVPNRRIYTSDDYERYSVLYDEKAKLRAIEFFYGLYKKSQSFKDKLLYFQNYYYLKNNGEIRISGCNFKKQDLTVDEKFNLYYCAKESMPLGNLKEEKVKEILKKSSSKEEEKRIKNCCSKCGHYITIPSIKGVLNMIKEIFTPGIWIIYGLLARL